MKHKYRIGVDVGNTFTKVNLNNSKVIIIETQDFINNHDSQEINSIHCNIQTADECIVSVSSVIGDEGTQKVTQRINDCIRYDNTKTIVWESNDIIQKSTIINSSSLEHLGTDRALRIYYLNKLAHNTKETRIGCGCGTAFTVEVVRNHCLVESYIIPGLDMQLESLNKKTAKLPLINSKQILKQLSKEHIFSTPYSIMNGVLNVYTGVIDNLLKKFHPATVVLSGGYAEVLKKLYEGNNDISVVKNLESKVLIDLV
ncbi:MAG: type III pantothenate kinase [Burkholderiales bacterium]|nr:type III pantothenate kinase [Burkholderiales bacterium]